MRFISIFLNFFANNGVKFIPSTNGIWYKLQSLSPILHWFDVPNSVIYRWQSWRNVAPSISSSSSSTAILPFCTYIFAGNFYNRLFIDGWRTFLDGGIVAQPQQGNKDTPIDFAKMPTQRKWNSSPKICAKIIKPKAKDRVKSKSKSNKWDGDIAWETFTAIGIYGQLCESPCKIIVILRCPWRFSGGKRMNVNIQAII